MDTTFTLFVFTAATIIAIGGALLLVGYIYVLPTSFSRGWKWGVLTAAPIIVTALYMGLRAFMPPDSNKIAFFVLLASLLGPVLFCVRHWRDNRKPGIQMLIGLVCIAAAAALVYGGLGQQFAEKIVGEIQQRESEQGVQMRNMPSQPLPAMPPMQSEPVQSPQSIPPANSVPEKAQ